MEIYKDSFVDKDEFDFENIIPYFKNPFDRTRSKYEAIMDLLSDKIQYIEKLKIFLSDNRIIVLKINLENFQRKTLSIHLVNHMRLCTVAF